MAATVPDMPEAPEIRLARLESDVAHIQSDVTDIKIDLRELRSETHGEFKAVRTEISGLRTEMQGEFKAVRTEISGLRTEMSKHLWALAGLLVTLFLAMGGIMARGFGWIH